MNINISDLLLFFKFDDISFSKETLPILFIQGAPYMNINKVTCAMITRANMQSGYTVAYDTEG